MPNYYEYRSPDVVWCVAQGHYTYEDTYNNYKRALFDPKSAPGVNVVIDVRESLETRTTDEMRHIAKLFSVSESFRGRCAMLVSPDSEVRYGLARMLGAFGDLHGLDFRVFVDESEALAWLDEAPTKVACNLDALTPSEREHRAELAEALRARVTSIKELDNGYVVKIEAEHPSSDIQALLDLERRCCPFLDFELVTSDGSVLTMTGPPGVKEIIAAMLV